MSIAKEAGIPVPEFFLSNDGESFIVRRFDRDFHGARIGFEDIAVLMGLNVEEKYKGSYEKVASTIKMYSAAKHRDAALAQLFDQVALSCIVGNGDAHLKNFGLLYSDPAGTDTMMSPAYDIVCTTCYIPNDDLALSLNNERSFLLASLNLETFGLDHCGVESPLGRIATIVNAARVILYTEHELVAQVPQLDQCIESSLIRYEKLVVQQSPTPLTY